MFFNEAEIVVKNIMEAGEVPLLWGHAGIGKTSLIKKIAKETNRELQILILSQMEPGDLIGLPTKEGEKTVFLAPYWWPKNDTNPTIIFLDEINRAHHSVRNAIMQMVIDREMAGHKLPDNVWIVAAANPPEDDYDQVELITDPAFLDRFVHLEIRPDPEELMQYYRRQHGVSNTFAKFVESNITSKSLDLGFEIPLTPRSIERAIIIHKQMLDNKVSLPLIRETLSGIIGRDKVSQFMTFLKRDSLSVKDILTGSWRNKKVNELERSELTAVLIDLLTNKIANEKLDINKIGNVLEFLKNLKDKEALGAFFRKMLYLTGNKESINEEAFDYNIGLFREYDLESYKELVKKYSRTISTMDY